MTTTTILVLILGTTSIIHGSEFLPCGDDNWISYGDEKCIRLFKSHLTRPDAQQHCSQLESVFDTPSLVTITSASEQLFLNEYVLNASDSNNVWISAERRPGSETEFVWIDGSPVQRFTNWRVGSPTTIIGRNCVQMVTMYTRQLTDLEWIDISCNSVAWFICEKSQTWSIQQLQRAVLALGRELKDSIDYFTDLITETRNLMTDMRSEMTSLRNEIANVISEIAGVRSEMTDNNNQLRNEMKSESTDVRNEMTAIRNGMNNNSTALRNELRNEISVETTSVRTEMRTETTSVRNEMITETTNVRTEMTTMRNSLNSQLQTLQSNPVPIGFIYVQLSGQSEPRTIWPTVSWTEVTSQYAGLFFRAQGGGSAAFGSVQEGFSPRITRIDTNWVAGTPTLRVTFPLGSNGWEFLTIGRWSNLDSVNTNFALQFTESVGEIRPRNSAVRIWRRNQ